MSRAETLFQNLRHGIDLLNLLMFYPAPGNEAIVATVDQLLEEDRLQRAVADLDLLERDLRELPETSGPQVNAPDYRELSGGPLKDLLRRLSLLHALFEGKNGAGATDEVRAELALRPWPDLSTLQRALVEMHQLKAGV